MAGAARVGDMTKHNTPLGPSIGSPNVFIEGLPAWRAIVDTHVCPKSDGSKPHVGGVVAKGSTKVFINNFPAARQGDQIVEAGSPNEIKGGSTKVNIAD